MDGPLELSQVPDHYPLSRRFGVKQNDKIRCVDDFSWSGINSAAQPLESPKPHTLDVYAALCVLVMSSCGHPNSKWLGRTFDLTGAYRQCAVHPESRPYAHIAVRHPSTGDIKAFRMLALPFAPIRSGEVSAFFPENLSQFMVSVGKGVSGIGHELFRRLRHSC